jgi:hypothetical protein
MNHADRIIPALTRCKSAFSPFSPSSMTKLLRLIAALAIVLTMTMGCSAFVVPVRLAPATYSHLSFVFPLDSRVPLYQQ